MSERSAALLADLARIVGPDHVRADDVTLEMHSFDAYLVRARPRAVVEPSSAQETAAVVRHLAEAGVPFLPRGAATGYAGGAVPIHNEVVISTRRLTAVRAFNPADRSIEVEAGVLTQTVKTLAASRGLCYPPDPSSFAVCTVGGNIATNAGGPHCLGYGTTANFVLEIECVAADGQIWRFGAEEAGLDLRGLIVGSEGTLAVITAVKLRLIEQPRSQSAIIATFDANEPAIRALVALFEAGRNPIALDMVSRVHDPKARKFRFRNDALLFVEAAGSEETVRREIDAMTAVFAAHGGRAAALSKDDYMQARFARTRERWTGVINETGLTGYFLFDAVVRRSDLGRMSKTLIELSDSFGFVMANTFHAGDGNIHPTPFFDRRDPDHLRQLDAFKRRVLTEVRELGGIATGEHGVGIEKADMLPSFFSPASFRKLVALKRRLDPHDLLNGGKVLARSGAEAPCEAPSPFSRALRDCLERDRILPFPVDGYVLVPGHVAPGELDERLRALRYRVPYLPLSGDRSLSLGLLLRDGVRSLLEHGHGHPRDLLLGALVREAAGELQDFGTFFQKDVTGYGLRRLLFGSGTRFGTFEALALRLTPRPERMAFVLVSGPADDPGQLLGEHRAVMAGKVTVRDPHRGGAAQLLALEGFEAEVELALEALHRARKRGVRVDEIGAEEVGALFAPRCRAPRPPPSTMETSVLEAMGA